MRFITKLIVLALEIFVVGLALNQLLGGVLGLPESPIVALLPEIVRPMGPWGVRFYWMALLALPILHVLILFSLYRRGRAIIFKTSPTDSLSLTRSAVTQCVRTELAEEPAIVKHKVIISQAGRRAVDLRIELRVKPIENIPEMQARLGRQVRRALSDILGLENIRHIKVDVTSIEEPRKRRSDSPIPVVRRIEAPKAKEGSTSAGDKASGHSTVSEGEEHEPRDAEFRVDDDPSGKDREFATLRGGEASEPETPTAQVYDTGTIQVEAGTGENAEPQEIELAEPGSAAEPAPAPAGEDELKTDDLLEILGKSRRDEKNKSS